MATQAAVLNEDGRTEQMCQALNISNRLTVAKIRLKRSDHLSDALASKIEGITGASLLLTDSILLGEDVLKDLKIIHQRITELEQKLDA